jgi:hypothetical protein
MMKAILLNNHYHVLTWHAALAQPLERMVKYMERKSIKTHLALTEAMMRTANTSHLTNEQRVKRAEAI